MQIYYVLMKRFGLQGLFMLILNLNCVRVPVTHKRGDKDERGQPPVYLETRQQLSGLW